MVGLRTSSAGTALGKRIEERMAELGLNASSASAKAGAGSSLVRDIIQGKAINPRMDTLLALAKALDCSMDFLTGVSETPGSAPKAADTSVDRFLLRRIGNAVEKRRVRFGLALAESVTDETLEHYDALVAVTDMDDPEEIDLRVRLLEKNFAKRDF